MNYLKLFEYFDPSYLKLPLSVNKFRIYENTQEYHESLAFNCDYPEFNDLLITSRKK